MGRGLIKLEEGILVETEVEGTRNISGGAAERVAKSLEQVGPLLKKICKPIASVWDELNTDLSMEEAEVTLGLSFEGQGNLYVTKAKVGSNLSIKLKLKPKPKEEETASGQLSRNGDPL